RFIYCGKIDLTNLQGPKVLELLMAVDELNIQSLSFCIQEHLTKHQDDFLQRILLKFLKQFINMNHLQNYGIIVLTKFAQNLKCCLILINLLT
ncbi:hypothetical protein C1645_790569, partial [Glomus cerebriforme]